MTKFQMKMVRFARVVLGSEFAFFAGGIVGIVIMILSILKYGEVVAVALYIAFLSWPIFFNSFSTFKA
ncbi:hypothetical protein ES703_96188 [subsurface metagenome]